MTLTSILIRAALAVALLTAVATPQAQPRGSAPPRDSKEDGDESWEIEQRKQWFLQSRGLNQRNVLQASQARSQAVAQLRQQVIRNASANILAGEIWTPIGPSAMKMGQYAMGPVSGRLNAIAQQPGNDNIVYVGAAAGGVWKTTNAGASWTPVFDNVGTQPIGSIFIEPTAPQNVWVATGDRNGACAGYFGQGVYLSTDSGATWAQRNGGTSTKLALGVVNAVVVQPTNSSVILAGGGAGRDCPGNQGLYRSTDRGLNWTRVLIDQYVEDILFAPNSSTAYATVSGQGVYKSINGGSTWSKVSTGLTPGSGRVRLAMAPSDANTLYALTGGGALYRSSNAGVSWTLRNSAACEGQCNYNLSLAVHPTNPNEVLVGTIRVARSADGGTTLTPLTNEWGDQQQVHQDTHVVRYSTSSPSRMWVGSDGGIWRTDNSAASWVNMNSNLGITLFYDIAVDPYNADLVFGGAQDNSSSGRGSDGQWNLTVSSGDGFMNVIDSTATNVVFQTSYPSNGFPNIYRSVLGGTPNSFQYVGMNGVTSGVFPWVTPLIGINGQVFMGGGSRMYRATANAALPFTWTPVTGSELTDNPSVITALQVGTSTQMYVGTQTGRILASANASAATPVFTNVTGNYSYGMVTDIAIDPSNRLRVFATSNNSQGVKLVRSTTGGTTWTAMGTGLPKVPAMSVAIDPLNVNRIFVGTDIGVYVSTDGGTNFTSFSTGLPLGIAVNDLEIDSNPHVLVAGTYGRGAWKTPLSSVVQNKAPTANFNMAVSGLRVDFTDTSTDGDGSIATRNWNFGDGTSSTLANPSKTYAAEGYYTVILTVTDNAGSVDTEAREFLVEYGMWINNGNPVPNLSAAINTDIRFRFEAPAGVSNLRVTTGANNGDAELYVKLGAPPETTVYDCRSINVGSNESCVVAAPQAGVYYGLIRAKAAYTGLTLTGAYDQNTTQQYSSDLDVAISDSATVESPITISGRTGNAPAQTSVTIGIDHTYIGDLKVDLVAPDGSVYILHNRAGGSADNIYQTYTVNLSSEAINGTWKLRVNDNGPGDVGKINNWSITL